MSDYYIGSNVIIRVLNREPLRQKSPGQKRRFAHGNQGRNVVIASFDCSGGHHGPKNVAALQKLEKARKLLLRTSMRSAILPTP